MTAFGLTYCREFVRKALRSRFGSLYIFGVLFLPEHAERERIDPLLVPADQGLKRV